MTEWASREQDIRRRAEIGGNISAKMAREVFAALDEARQAPAGLDVERLRQALRDMAPAISPHLADGLANRYAALASPDSERPA